ncbi:MAG TPA: SDR family oxidoreductase [Candidatus Dormibacteraeota bacterium]|nr:SDR family oxidoreductase [Candidatus Dormibacteraeota bacterium]
MDIAGCVAVVTGGARGIGRALSRRLVEEGARTVVVADLDGVEAEAVAAEIGGTGVWCDVADEAAVRALVENVEEVHGGVDLWCSNAGIAVRGGPEVPDADWERIWRVNVMAHVYAARAVIPGMLERGRGHLLGTVSAAGLLNHVFAAPYAVTKSAALSLFEWLAIAHGDAGIGVSVLCPQGVRTDMAAAEGPAAALLGDMLEPSEVAAIALQGVREGRFLILPHPEVAGYAQRRAADHDRWLRGMRRLRDRVTAGGGQG